jgi:hypothetical protein
LARQEILEEKNKIILGVIQSHEVKKAAIVDRERKRHADIKITRESTLQHHLIKQGELDQKTKAASAQRERLRRKLDYLANDYHHEKSGESQGTIEQPRSVQQSEDIQSDRIHLKEAERGITSSENIQSDGIHADESHLSEWGDPEKGHVL